MVSRGTSWNLSKSFIFECNRRKRDSAFIRRQNPSEFEEVINERENEWLSGFLRARTVCATSCLSIFELNWISSFRHSREVKEITFADNSKFPGLILHNKARKLDLRASALLDGTLPNPRNWKSFLKPSTKQKETRFRFSANIVKTRKQHSARFF